MILNHIQKIIISSFYLFYNQFFHQCQGTPLVGKDVIKAENNEFPYMVSISYNETEIHIKNHMCGGTLITYKHDLTAAHCVKDEENYDDLLVKMKSTDLRNAEKYEIKWWVTYNEWAGLCPGMESSTACTHHNDIAIIKLVKKVSSCIMLGILTKQPEEDLYDRKAKTVGWGFIENKVIPIHLRTVELTVHYPENCLFNKLQLDEESDRKLNSKKFLCTFADPPAVLGCGDSGGPLLLNKREIIGVNVGSCSEDDDPRMLKDQNLHSSINFYRDFIQDVAKPGCIRLAYNKTRC